MSPVASTCLLCEMRTVVWGWQPAVPQPWHFVRFASSARLARRKPARMALSPNVARSSDRFKDSKKKPPPTFKNNPFGGMNQTRARLPDRPIPRSDAQLKRSSSDLNNKEKDAADKKQDGSLFRALKMQIALSPIPYSRRNRIKEKIAAITSFDQFPLLPQVRDAVYANAFPTLTEISPTPIQRVAIPALLRPPISGTEKNKRKKKQEEEEEELFHFDQFLLAAETGTGKTLAYLLPIINWIKQAEMVEKDTELMDNEETQQGLTEKSKENLFELEAPELATPEHSNVARPRAIILVPTAELVEQVGKLAKQLSHTAKFRSATISSVYTPRRITNSLFNPAGIDILISTPHLLTSIAKTNPYILSRVAHLVIDEADSLLDKSFSPLTYSIIEKTAPSLTQLILCSATIPRSLDSLMEKKFPEMKRLVTPNLHAIPRRVQLGVVDVDKDPYRGNKKLACADIIWSLGKAGVTQEDAPDDGYPASLFPEPKHIIVFVNERETTEDVAAFLSQKGIHTAALSRDTPDQRKDEILAEFTHVKPLPSPQEVKDAQRNKRNWFSDSVPFARDENSHLGPQRNLRDTKVLVTTDLGSRGIDTVAVRNVILFDVPHTTIDFIHRLGRTGRMGRRGRGIVLVSKKDRKDVVKEVREAMFRGQALI
ncbi:ATP-dependent RNA helicase MRH4 [Histoplasma capsulatum G186AR]|uniref:RNA helicase n=2 Tax=Ajellomyces capsulatus TaxID=5037 RepID=C0NM42_AJECG|nr:ATP-dependent RNA helicase MRH4 [Histoplasma capsulatum G186AR]EEH07693.1 ATP-dependent RNA helicase MRH4 [Histoplasma capsulatum G186AR]KAG5304167.1 ATP-dependent RNA helicase MRH4 [Histoplasma capsulatum]QSS69766.1 ATP-dependent RNA helicase MRH4 [Histoplasma capsulatum G186AR]